MYQRKLWNDDRFAERQADAETVMLRMLIVIVESGSIRLIGLEAEQQYTVHLSAGNDIGFGPSVKFVVDTPTLEQSGTGMSHAPLWYLARHSRNIQHVEKGGFCS